MMVSSITKKTFFIERLIVCSDICPSLFYKYFTLQNTNPFLLYSFTGFFIRKILTPLLPPVHPMEIGLY